MSGTTRRRPLLAGLLLAAVAAGLVAGWWAANDRAPCEETGVFACAGPGLLMALFGVPLGLVAGALVLRFVGRSRSGILGVVVVVAVTWAAVLLAEPWEPPLATWPVVVGLLGAVYVRLERRAVGD